MIGNSRMGRVLPDVAPVDVPLVTAMLRATDAFGAGRDGRVAVPGPHPGPAARR